MYTSRDIEHWIYTSYMAAKTHMTETLDEKVRRPHWTRAILDALGSPDQAIRNVAVTGSKGKGSTAVMIAEILRAHGWKVGLFTSPHLTHFTERIRLNQEEIPEEMFVRLGRQVKAVVDPLSSELAPFEYFGPVGLTAAIAALYFKEKKADIVIWECGRGALFDDINQITHEVAVITPIMEEHLTHLGPRLTDVIRHKLGIVTPAVRAVCIGQQQAEACREIAEFAARWENKEIVQLGENVCLSDVEANTEGAQLTLRTPYHRYERVKLPLLGAFQAENAALAIASAEQAARLLVNPPMEMGSAPKRHRPTPHALRRNPPMNKGSAPKGDIEMLQVGRYANLPVEEDWAPIDDTLVHTALAHVQWPGRLEILSQQPLIIVDGAIHRRSAKYVADMLSQLNHKRGILIVGVPRDKDYNGVIQVLAPFANKVIVTVANHDYLQFPADAPDVAKRFCSRVEFKERALDAFCTGLRQLAPGEWLAIVGTQSLVGESQKFFSSIHVDVADAAPINEN